MRKQSAVEYVRPFCKSQEQAEALVNKAQEQLRNEIEADMLKFYKPAQHPRLTALLIG
jgi:hypothetical protein